MNGDVVIQATFFLQGMEDWLWMCDDKAVPSQYPGGHFRKSMGYFVGMGGLSWVINPKFLTRSTMTGDWSNESMVIDRMEYNQSRYGKNRRMGLSNSGMWDQQSKTTGGYDMKNPKCVYTPCYNVQIGDDLLYTFAG